MIGSLFSGVGGLDLGLEMAGLGPVAWQCEIDPFCREVLAKHWPHTPRYADVRQLRGSDLPLVPILCGGFPCQDLSQANPQGRKLDGARSGLWFEYLRLVRELEPDGVVIENVRGLTGRALGTVVSGLHEAGYEVEGTTIRAADVGAPHLRARVFLVCVRRERVGPGWWRQTLADADERRREEQWFQDGQLGRHARGHLADRRSPTRPCQGADAFRQASRWARRGPDWADPDRFRQEYHLDPLADPLGEGRADGERPPEGGRSELGPVGGGCAESGLDRATNGLPRGLVGPGPRGDWPCPRGSEGRIHGKDGWSAPQHEWEEPRTASGVANSGKRRKALGNSVVPQCAYIAGLRLRQLLEGR